MDYTSGTHISEYSNHNILPRKHFTHTPLYISIFVILISQHMSDMSKNTLCPKPIHLMTEATSVLGYLIN